MPQKFIFVGRSKPVESLSPRGGVALFRNMRSNIDVELVTNDFVDCIICRILPVNLICISVYIPLQLQILFNGILKIISR